jgi:hypothetical protein
LAAVLVAACGGGESTTPKSSAADISDIVAEDAGAGVTPFIRFVKLRGTSVAQLDATRYTVAPKPGTASRPVDVEFNSAALIRRGYYTPGSGQATLPVFGLYANHDNGVTITLRFKDGSSKLLTLSLQTAAYVDPVGIYDHAAVVTRRAVGSTLGFDFIAIKSRLGAPVVIDTDGEIRWATTGFTDSTSSAFHDNAFFVGDAASTKTSRIDLDGTVSTSRLIASDYTRYHHNIDIGKFGLLVEVDAQSVGVVNVEAILAEVTTSGAVIREWDFAKIIGDFMASRGDDPAEFVRPGIDWFHMNAATYDARDDSIIASSRENFVIKIDYRTSEIIWILGDPTKYWYTFPSLRAKALTLPTGDLYPIGQHAVSVTLDGLVLLFNDGLSSMHQPAGTSPGETRTFSAVSGYSIDLVTRTAREALHYEHTPSIFSDICSSAYQSPDRSMLVNYSTSDSRTTATVTGLAPDRSTVFELKYQSPIPCSVSWNASPIAFDNLIFE